MKTWPLRVSCNDYRSCGCSAQLTFDSTEPDGTTRKLMDISRMRVLGWQHNMPLKKGINICYQDMLYRINQLNHG